MRSTITSNPASPEYRSGWDAVYGKKQKKEICKLKWTFYRGVDGQVNYQAYDAPNLTLWVILPHLCLHDRWELLSTVDGQSVRFHTDGPRVSTLMLLAEHL